MNADLTANGLSRRQFLKSAATATAGLVIGFSLPLGGRRAEAQAPAAAPLVPNAFVRVGADESVTILLSHSEMGQGIWTTLPILLAEELGCDWSKIRVEHAPAAPAYKHTAFGMQMTGGSTTTWSEFGRYRQVGAMARTLLIQAAAAEWKAEPKDCRVENGFVIQGDRKLSFGHLAAAAEALTPPAEPPLKQAAEWTRIGKPHKRLDSHEKVTGQAQYGMDVHWPGLLTAQVERAPVFGGKLKSFQADAAKAVPGVKMVLEVPSGVAVVADNFWAAKKGREALEIEWDLGPGSAVDTEAQREEYARMARQPGLVAAQAGDVEAALASAKSVLEAEYDLPYLAHAAMEPLNCTVKIDAEGCEIWTGTQFQTGDQMAAAMILGLKPEQVKLHTPFLGGGYGRRAVPGSPMVAEAVLVAKAAGTAVKVVWTREDDTRGGYYRPMAHHRLRVGVGADGYPAAWRQSILCQSIMAGTPFEMMVKGGIDQTCVEGAADSPYVEATASHLVELQSPKKPVPVLWWRSVGHTHTAFAMESFVDELAHAAGVDPLEYRRKLLAKDPRRLGVLELAAEKAGWGKPLPEGRFRGLAVHNSFGSYVAQVAEISVDKGQVRVHRVVCAMDCGVVVNPAGLLAQMEGGIVYGLSAALHGEIGIKEGRVIQSNFHDYMPLRLVEMPVIEGHIVPSAERPGGGGEPPVPVIAPAVANAIFAATGKRLRSLPFRLA